MLFYSFINFRIFWGEEIFTKAMLPSKQTKVMRNRNWSELEKEVIIEQCSKTVNVIHRAITSKIGGFYIPFNSQDHIGTSPPHCHL